MKSSRARNTTVVERKDKDGNVVGYRVYYWDGDVRKNKSYKKTAKEDADRFAREWVEEHLLPDELVVGVDDRITLAASENLKISMRP